MNVVIPNGLNNDKVVNPASANCKGEVVYMYWQDKALSYSKQYVYDSRECFDKSQHIVQNSN